MGLPKTVQFGRRGPPDLVALDWRSERIVLCGIPFLWRLVDIISLGLFVRPIGLAARPDFL